jgi:hypothetical protein
MMARIDGAPQAYAFLTVDEALFIESAFSCLLPDDDDLAWRSSPGAARFVDDRVQSSCDCTLRLAVDLAIGELRLTGEQVARTYRSGIAAVRRHCLARHGEAFHDLPQHSRHLVLGLLERGARSAGLHGHEVLFSLLVQHAAEAYFDATHIALARAERRGWRGHVDMPSPD